mmetsp:Transcript_12890/g.37826  ORF Transcript_12890/g.37826 Transcript_12890/m.37826 type:complete len:141 (-) Transcript_12890:1091-1513(-)
MTYVSGVRHEGLGVASADEVEKHKKALPRENGQGLNSCHCSACLGDNEEVQSTIFLFLEMLGCSTINRVSTVAGFRCPCLRKQRFASHACASAGLMLSNIQYPQIAERERFCEEIFVLPPTSNYDSTIFACDLSSTLQST